MVSKIKKYILFAVVLNCVACSNVQNDKNSELQQPVEVENKTDLKKAALLNIELGQNYLAQGQVSRAKKKLLHALELAPNLAEAHSSLGYFYETVGDNKMAEKYYRKAIFLGKEQGVFHNSYGLYLCGQNKYKEADKEFSIAVQDSNYAKTAEVYENAGMCALKAANLPMAENYFKIAVRYDSKQVASLMELAEMVFKRGDIEQSQYYLGKLRAQVEPTPRILWLAIQIARKNSDNDALASNALLLKNLFANSQEYKLYLASQ